MFRTLTGLLGLVAILAAVGCEAVYMAEPIGGRPETFDMSQLEGTWHVEEDAVLIKVTDPDEGRFVAAGIQDEDGTLTLRLLEFAVREVNRWHLLQVRTEEDDPARSWSLVGRLTSVDNNGAVLVPLDTSKVIDLVRSGDLPGTVGERNAVLGELTDEHLNRLTDEKQELLFLWDQPQHIRKLK